jgi:hypothetical protein
MMKIRFEIQPKPLDDSRFALKPLDCGLSGIAVFDDLPNRFASQLRPGTVIEFVGEAPANYPVRSHGGPGGSRKALYAEANKARELLLRVQGGLADPNLVNPANNAIVGLAYFQDEAMSVSVKQLKWRLRDIAANASTLQRMLQTNGFTALLQAAADAMTVIGELEDGVARLA